MRHNCKVKHFSRANGPRKALLRGLVYSLVEHGRIKTTIAKAKELRRHVERAVTLGKKGDLAARRLLLSRYPNPDTVGTIMKDLSPRFQSRPGGYTRIIRVGARPGDQAEMAYIEWVDYSPKAKVDGEKQDNKAKVKAKRLQQRTHAKHAKRKRTLQRADRIAARA